MLGVQNSLHFSAMRRKNSGGRLVEVGERLVLPQCPQDSLADLKAEELRQEAAPCRLSAARSGLDDHSSIGMLNMNHCPTAAAKQETADAVDEPIDECLVQRADRLPSGRLYG